MHVIKKEDFNTNNACGFGGGQGTRTFYDNGLVLYNGRLSFRHTPSYTVTKWQYSKDGSVYNCSDVIGEKTKKIYVYQTEHDVYAFFQEQTKPEYKLIKTINL